jgi:biotin carboxyl carrier protein
MDKKVLAPMPGLVARVMVEKGANVTAGQVVAVLNVMKTEVSVVAQEPGKVKEILVKEWDEMDVGTPMIIFE